MEPQQFFSVFIVVKIFLISTLAFFINLIITHFWTGVLYRYFKPGKQIERTDTPIFNLLHQKKEGTPTMGGLPVWVTVASLTVVFWILSNIFNGTWTDLNFLSRSQTLLPLGFLILAGLVGMADDILGIFRRKGFPIKQRFFIFLSVALLGAWWFYFKLGFDAVNVPFIGDITVGWWYMPVFILVVIAMAFSADLTDGLDGLIGGVFMIIFAAQAVIAFYQGRMDMVVFLAAIMGALIAFLWYNIFPAKFFMGDTGVMALGFVAGVVAMLTDTPFLLLLIAIVPVLESLSVMVQIASKKLRGKKIFPSTPIHHTFEAIGWPESQITMRFWMINAIGAIIGLIIFLVDSKIPPLF